MHGLRDLKARNERAARETRPTSVERELRKLSTGPVTGPVVDRIRDSVDLTVMDLHWLRNNYAAAPTSEINARIDTALARLAG